MRLPRLPAAAACALAALVATAPRAAPFEVAVRSEAPNLYKVEGKPLLVLTRGCSAAAQSSDAILNANAGGGSLIFIASGETCAIAGVFARTAAQAGRYPVILRRYVEDWYQTHDDALVQTSKCHKPANAEAATLTLDAGGRGRLAFGEGPACVVVGVHTRQRID